MHTSTSHQFEVNDTATTTLNLKGHAAIYLHDGAMGSVIYCDASGPKGPQFVRYLEDLSTAAADLAHRIKAWTESNEKVTK